MDEELRQFISVIKKSADITIKFSGNFAELSKKIFKLPENIKQKIRDRHHKIMADAQYKQFKLEKKSKLFGNDAPEQIRQNVSKLLSNEITGFSFTGQVTDMCYFRQSESMPISAIANIPNDNIKMATIKTFDKAIANGEVKIQGDYLIITDKGKKFINDKNFIRQAENDQMKAYNRLLSTGKGVAMTGDYKSDFTVFKHTDSIDLKDIINYPNKEISSKILGNVKQWQEKGAVKVDKNGIAIITQSGKKILNMPEFANSVQQLSEESLQALQNTSRKIIVVTKKIVETPKIARKSILPVK